jgi:hypothetical protein
MPGSDLSQPAKVTMPSSRSACITVSTESAMTSRRHQRGAHALVAHRDAVGHRDGVELDREAAGVAHALLGLLGEPVERQVAGGDLVPRRGDPTWGLPQSSSVMPMARSIARAGARS